MAPLSDGKDLEEIELFHKVITSSELNDKIIRQKMELQEYKDKIPEIDEISKMKNTDIVKKLQVVIDNILESNDNLKEFLNSRNADKILKDYKELKGKVTKTDKTIKDTMINSKSKFKPDRSGTIKMGQHMISNGNLFPIPNFINNFFKDEADQSEIDLFEWNPIIPVKLPPNIKENNMYDNVKGLTRMSYTLSGDVKKKFDLHRIRKNKSTNGIYAYGSANLLKINKINEVLKTADTDSIQIDDTYTTDSYKTLDDKTLYFFDNIKPKSGGQGSSLELRHSYTKLFISFLIFYKEPEMINHILITQLHNLKSPMLVEYRTKIPKSIIFFTLKENDDDLIVDIYILDISFRESGNSVLDLIKRSYGKKKDKSSEIDIQTMITDPTLSDSDHIAQSWFKYFMNTDLKSFKLYTKKPLHSKTDTTPQNRLRFTVNNVEKNLLVALFYMDKLHDTKKSRVENFACMLNSTTNMSKIHTKLIKLIKYYLKLGIIDIHPNLSDLSSRKDASLDIEFDNFINIFVITFPPGFSPVNIKFTEFQLHFMRSLYDYFTGKFNDSIDGSVFNHSGYEQSILCLLLNSITTSKMDNFVLTEKNDINYASEYPIVNNSANGVKYTKSFANYNIGVAVDGGTDVSKPDCIFDSKTPFTIEGFLDIKYNIDKTIENEVLIDIHDLTSRFENYLSVTLLENEYNFNPLVKYHNEKIVNDEIVTTDYDNYLTIIKHDLFKKTLCDHLQYILLCPNKYPSSVYQQDIMSSILMFFWQLALSHEHNGLTVSENILWCPSRRFKLEFKTDTITIEHTKDCIDDSKREPDDEKEETSGGMFGTVSQLKAFAKDVISKKVSNITRSIFSNKEPLTCDGSTSIMITKKTLLSEYFHIISNGVIFPEKREYRTPINPYHNSEYNYRELEINYSEVSGGSWLSRGPINAYSIKKNQTIKEKKRQNMLKSKQEKNKQNVLKSEKHEKSIQEKYCETYYDYKREDVKDLQTDNYISIGPDILIEAEEDRIVSIERTCFFTFVNLMIEEVDKYRKEYYITHKRYPSYKDKDESEYRKCIKLFLIKTYGVKKIIADKAYSILLYKDRKEKKQYDCTINTFLKEFSPGNDYEYVDFSFFRYTARRFIVTTPVWFKSKNDNMEKFKDVTYTLAYDFMPLTLYEILNTSILKEKYQKSMALLEGLTPEEIIKENDVYDSEVKEAEKIKQAILENGEKIKQKILEKEKEKLDHKEKARRLFENKIVEKIYAIKRGIEIITSLYDMTQYLRFIPEYIGTTIELDMCCLSMYYSKVETILFKTNEVINTTRELIETSLTESEIPYQLSSAIDSIIEQNKIMSNYSKVVSEELLLWITEFKFRLLNNANNNETKEITRYVVDITNKIKRESTEENTGIEKFTRKFKNYVTYGTTTTTSGRANKLDSLIKELEPKIKYWTDKFEVISNKSEHIMNILELVEEFILKKRLTYKNMIFYTSETEANETFAKETMDTLWKYSKTHMSGSTARKEKEDGYRLKNLLDELYEKMKAPPIENIEKYGKNMKQVSKWNSALIEIYEIANSSDRNMVEFLYYDNKEDQVKNTKMILHYTEQYNLLIKLWENLCISNYYAYKRLQDELWELNTEQREHDEKMEQEEQERIDRQTERIIENQQAEEEWNQYYEWLYTTPEGNDLLRQQDIEEEIIEQEQQLQEVIKNQLYYDSCISTYERIVSVKDTLMETLKKSKKAVEKTHDSIIQGKEFVRQTMNDAYLSSINNVNRQYEKIALSETNKEVNTAETNKEKIKELNKTTYESIKNIAHYEPKYELNVASERKFNSFNFRTLRMHTKNNKSNKSNKGRKPAQTTDGHEEFRKAIEIIKKNIERFDVMDKKKKKQEAELKKVGKINFIRYIANGVSILTPNRIRESVHGSTETYTIEKPSFDSYEPAKDKSYMIKVGIKKQILNLSNKLTTTKKLGKEKIPPLTEKQRLAKEREQAFIHRQETILQYKRDRLENPVSLNNPYIHYVRNPLTKEEEIVQEKAKALIGRIQTIKNFKSNRQNFKEKRSHS
jgi:hypothetical protein